MWRRILLAVEGCSEHPNMDPDLPDTPAWTQGPPLLPNWATSKFAGEYTGTLHAHLVWEGDTAAHTPTRSRHQAHRL